MERPRELLSERCGVGAGPELPAPTHPTSPGSAANVLAEPDGSVGTVCVYQASSPEAIRKHAIAADLPVDDIVKVADTVKIRADRFP